MGYELYVVVVKNERKMCTGRAKNREARDTALCGCFSTGGYIKLLATPQERRRDLRGQFLGSLPCVYIASGRQI